VKHLRVFLFPLLVFAVAALVACGDDEADTGEPDRTSPAATRDDDSPAATSPGDDSPGATSPGDESPLDDEVQVQADDFRFSPEGFSLPAGAAAKIEVTNVGAAPHTLTVYSDEEYTTAVPGADTDTIEAGEDASIETTFSAGQYFFRCEIHPSQMEGEFTAQ
jgi:plastocyanin